MKYLYQKWYKYKEINTIISRIKYAKYSKNVLELYPKLKQLYQENEKYIQRFENSIIKRFI